MLRKLAQWDAVILIVEGFQLEAQLIEQCFPQRMSLLSATAVLTFGPWWILIRDIHEAPEQFTFDVGLKGDTRLFLTSWKSARYRRLLSVAFANFDYRGLVNRNFNTLLPPLTTRQATF